MDLITFLMVLSLAFVFILIGILKTNYKKQQQGKKGEKIVAKSLKFWVEKQNKNYVYNDITLPTKSGRTTQIDHLVLSRKGIFVIETKYLNGTINGDIDKPHWKHINHLKHENQIYNPITQNTGHLKHLAQLIKVPMNEMTGIVTNVGNAKLSGSINPMFGKTAIEKGTGFVFKIWWSGKKPFSQDRIDEIKALIDETRLEQSDEVNNAHINYVKRFNSNQKGGGFVAVLAMGIIACFLIYWLA